MIANARDLADAAIITARFDIPAEAAYRSLTCRRLATVETKCGKRATGTLVQDRTITSGWVNTGSRIVYGKIVANHGTVWPDGKHAPEPEGIAGAPYIPPPEGWEYIP